MDSRWEFDLYFWREKHDINQVWVYIFFIVFYFSGDTLKGAFFFYTDQPLPFKMCAVIQVTVDLLIFLQVLIYKKPKTE